jgi:site-specific DNA-methyltransferase (adenine-specific)
MTFDVVLQGDCLEHLKAIPDDSIDITFADPPFNLNKKYASYQDRKAFDAYLEWCKVWIAEMVRVTKPTGSIFVHNIPKWLTYYAGFLNEIADFRHWIAWDAMGAPLGNTLLPNHYGILFYAKNADRQKFYEIRYPHHRCRRCGSLRKDYGGKKAALHPFGPLVADVWTDLHRIRHPKRRNAHPCQLPVPLLERIILMTTDEGDVVLDPFAGTGTSLVAAKRLGRRYIGIELDQRYVDISEANLRENSQTKIGDVWVSIYLDQIVTIRDKDWGKLAEHFSIPNPIEQIDSTPIRLKDSEPFRNGHDADVMQLPLM